MSKERGEEADKVLAPCCGEAVSKYAVSVHMVNEHDFTLGDWKAWPTTKQDEVKAAIKAGKWDKSKHAPSAPSPSTPAAGTSTPAAAEPAPAASKPRRTAADSPPTEDPRDYLMKKMIDSHPGFNQAPAPTGPTATGTTASFTPTAQQPPAGAPLATSREEDLRVLREKEDKERKEREARELKDREDREKRDREDKERRDRDEKAQKEKENLSKAGMDVLASKFDQLLELEKTRANTDLKKEKEDAIKREDESRKLLSLIADRLDPEKAPKKKKKDEDEEDEDPDAAATRAKKRRRRELGPFADVYETVEEQTKAKLSKALTGQNFQWDAPTISALEDVAENVVGGIGKYMVLQNRRGDRKEARLERKEERLFRKELALDFFRANNRMPTLREMSMLMGATMIPEATKEEREDQQEIDEMEEEIISSDAGSKLIGLAPAQDLEADKIPKVSDKVPTGPAPPSSAESTLKAKLAAAQRSPPIGPAPGPPRPPAAPPSPSPPKNPEEEEDDLEAALAKEAGGKK